MNNSPGYVRKTYKKSSVLSSESNLINETKLNKNKKYDRSSSRKREDKEIKLLNKKKKTNEEKKEKTTSKSKKKEVKIKPKKIKRTNRNIDNNIRNNNNENRFNNPGYRNFIYDLTDLTELINPIRNHNNIQISSNLEINDSYEDFFINEHFFEDNFFERPLFSIFRANLFSNFQTNIFRPFEFTLILNEEPNNNTNPTSTSILKKLKKFQMNDNYCKKNSNGELELPNCCICISEIKKKEKTVLLPCGHLFHWKCCSKWLNNNNTCPVCRFKLTEIN